MTDSSNTDRELDAAIARLVSDAGSDAPEAPEVSSFTVTELSGPRRDPTGRWVAIAAIGSIAAAVAVLAFVVIDDDGTGTLRPAGTATMPTPSVSPTAPA